MDPATVGLIGGITGGVLGTLGGVVGTYVSIANCKTAAERRFLTRWAAIAWFAMLIFLVAPMTLVVIKILPGWIPLMILPVFLTAWMRSLPAINRRAVELRESAGAR